MVVEVTVPMGVKEEEEEEFGNWEEKRGPKEGVVEKAASMAVHEV